MEKGRPSKAAIVGSGSMSRPGTKGGPAAPALCVGWSRSCVCDQASPRGQLLGKYHTLVEGAVSSIRDDSCAEMALPPTESRGWTQSANRMGVCDPRDIRSSAADGLDSSTGRWTFRGRLSAPCNRHYSFPWKLLFNLQVEGTRKCLHGVPLPPWLDPWPKLGERASLSGIRSSR